MISSNEHIWNIQVSLNRKDGVRNFDAAISR